jgi:plastocyanin
MNPRAHSTGALARLVGGAALLAVAITGVTVSSTSAADGGARVKKIVMRDECEPVSFNAAVGAGTCVGDGKVTFQELLASLPAGGSKKWVFKPAKTTEKSGTVLHVVNRGGETHSFTEVSAFGTGIVPPLNAALPPDTEPAVPVPGDPLFIPAGGTGDTPALSPGVHMFQCLIHPWMRSVVTIKSK